MQSRDIIEEWVSAIDRQPIPDIEKFLVSILLVNALRVSEIANTQRLKVLNEREMLIYEYKTSKQRVVHIHHYQNVAKQIVQNGGTINWTRDRNYYYRVFKRAGINWETANRENNAVTHAARYEKAQRLMSETENIDTVKDALHHKSASSTEHYISDVKKKKKKNRGILSNYDTEIEGLVITKKGRIFFKKDK